MAQRSPGLLSGGHLCCCRNDCFPCGEREQGKGRGSKGQSGRSRLGGGPGVLVASSRQQD